MTDAASNDVQKGWGTQKSREITWHDPAPTTSMGASMAGLDFMRAIMDGQVPTPPLHSLMQINMMSVEPGKVVFTGAPDESTYNLTGVVHGGVICALLQCRGRCGAQHPAARQGKHIGGNQGELPQGRSTVQRTTHRDRNSGQVWLPCGLY